MIAYKLVRLRKNGTIGSLFINCRAVLPLNQWLQAEFYPTKGFAPRFGWHCTFKPRAPHLSIKERVWVEVEIEDFQTYDRPICQGGAWILAGRMKINKILDSNMVENILNQEEV